MYVKSLSLRGIRNYQSLELKLGPGINLFHGDNARGKTNLLEAVCYLGSLRSFRGAKASDVVSWGGKSGRISGIAVRGAGGGAAGGTGYAAAPAHMLSVGVADGKRRVTLDGKRPSSAADYLQALKVSSFSPEDLFLVKEYPSHRRRFLDRSIFHLYPGYLELANRYRRALAQLNASLKAGDGEVVRAWEDVLAPMAAEVNLRRKNQVSLLKGRASDIYDRVLGGGELDMSYRTPVEGGGAEELEAGYRDRLEAKRPEALRRGHCTVGPHADDLHMTLSGRDMRAAASRGQSRLALLALVLADCGLYNDERGEFPVLLLDDAASELDGRRRDALMGYVATMGQALLTSTGPDMPGGAAGRRYEVEGGRVTLCG